MFGYLQAGGVWVWRADAGLCEYFLNTGNGYYRFITVYTFSDYNLLLGGTFSSIFYYLPHWLPPP